MSFQPIEGRVAETRRVLERLGFSDAQTNDRSARVLLALLQLEPMDPWTAAANPMLGTYAIMKFIQEKYDHDYAARRLIG